MFKIYGILNLFHLYYQLFMALDKGPIAMCGSVNIKIILLTNLHLSDFPVSICFSFFMNQSLFCDDGKA